MAVAPRSVRFITVGVSGDKELARLFDELPKSLTDKVLQDTAKRALTPVAEMARAKVRRDDGDTAESITVSTRLSKRQTRLHKRRGSVMVHAGPSHRKGHAGHLIEFGTTERFHKKTGKSVGRMPASPFMRPAWDTLKGQVLETMRTDVWEVLRKAVARLRKRAEKGKLSKSATKFFAGKK